MLMLNNTLERKLIKQRIVPDTMIGWLDRHGKLSNKVLTVKILREECDISLFAAKIAVERWMELRVGKHDDSLVVPGMVVYLAQIACLTAHYADGWEIKTSQLSAC
jgi:hypothetical protein